MLNLTDTPMKTLAARSFSPYRSAQARWLIALGLAAALQGPAVFAQTASPAPASPKPPTAAPSAEPKYTLAQIAQAFGFIDANKDGKLSREEAAGFRGVARHFDEADANRDGALSREEFENALSGEKTR
jgi:hypothetical protein